MDEYYQVVQSLPSWLARPLLDMPSALAPDVQELRAVHQRSRCAGQSAHRRKQRGSLPPCSGCF